MVLSLPCSASVMPVRWFYKGSASHLDTHYLTVTFFWAYHDCRRFKNKKKLWTMVLPLPWTHITRPVCGK